MKKLLIIICCLVVSCFFVVNVFAAETCTYHSGNDIGKHIVYKWTIVADASGDMDITGSGCTSGPITGWLVQCEFWPDGTTPWTDGTADVEARGTNTHPSYNTNYDYCHGTGANLDSSITDSDNIRAPLTTDNAYILLHGVKLTPWVDEAGDGGTGILFITVKKQKKD